MANDFELFVLDWLVFDPNSYSSLPLPCWVPIYWTKWVNGDAEAVIVAFCRVIVDLAKLTIGAYLQD